MNYETFAIIGSGISGLSLFYYLNKFNIDVTLFEATDKVGGHSNTVKIDNEQIDLGFQVSNEMTYPNLYNLFNSVFPIPFVVPYVS